MQPVTTIIIDGIALIEINNPPVNASSHAVRHGLRAGVMAAGADPAVIAIVIAAAGRTFVAGADITEFGKPPLEPHLPDVLACIESCQKPVVVAWHGTALGGGCEIGLAAHARVIAASGQIGLPEVKLGLVPGAGGTQRLPRLCGTAAALGIITSGRMISAAEALKLGIVDIVVPDDEQRRVAISHAHGLVGKPLRRTSALSVPAGNQTAIEAEMVAMHKRARGQSAPQEAARLVQLAARLSVAEGLAEERATFLRLMAGEQSAALRYVFQSERAVGKRADLAAGEARAVQHVGIIGAGTMGAGIAAACLNAGFDITVVETTPEGLARGEERITRLLARAVSSGRLSEQGHAQQLARMRLSTELASLATADLVIEAVFEEMGVKTALLSKLEPLVRADCVLATNTSYLDIDAMARVLKRPENLVGLHFFSPANIMKLLEIVNAQKTSPDVLATARAVGKRLNKIAVVSGVCDGFIGNRIMARYRQECEFMLEEGALPQEIDAAFEQYGFAMGPFAVSDLAGLDISWARRKSLAPMRQASARYVPIADRLCEMGRFGQKTGAGWYLYNDGRRVVDPVVDVMVRDHAATTGLSQRVHTPESIMTRVLEIMGQEGEHILAEGIAARPLDIDLVMIHGYGFPAYKGGPMFNRARHAKDVTSSFPS